MSAGTRYLFGPRDQRGVIAGLRWGQIGILVGGGGCALALVMASRASLAALTAVGLVLVFSAACAFVPVAGRSLDEWAPAVAHYLLTGRRTWRSPQPHRGQRLVVGTQGEVRILAEQPAFPPGLRYCSLLSVQVPRGELGMVKDARLRTWTAVLRVSGSSFALLDGEEKARRMAAWGAVQGALAHRGSPVSALQVVVRSLTEDPAALCRHVAERHALDLRHPILRSYLTLLDDDCPTTQAQDVHIALQISLDRARRAIRQAGGGDAGAGAVLSRELQSLQAQLRRADIHVDGALPPRLLAQTLREAWNPTAVSGFQLAARHHPEREGVAVSAAGPLCTRASWRYYETDSALHVSYWISEWPRTEVAPGYLVPLLLETPALLRVAVTMEPVDPIRARRDLEAARTEHLADQDLRDRHGFRTSVEKERQAEGVERREAELSDGHAEYRFSGHVTVSAATVAELERGCSAVEEHAATSCLELRRMDGEHDLGFCATLPLGRGMW